MKDCSVSIFDSSNDSTLEYDGISENDDDIVNPNASEISLNIVSCGCVVEIMIFVKVIVDDDLGCFGISSDDNEDMCSKAKLDTRSEVIVASTDDVSVTVGVKVDNTVAENGLDTFVSFDRIAADELSEIISTSVWFRKYNVVVIVLKSDSTANKVK